MEPAPSFEVRCPLHGSIPFSTRERALIDHPLVQRLRLISQLGFAHLVYPGATHTRFSHALGVMHLAGRIFDRICAAGGLEHYLDAGRLAYCREVLRLAGLLHDLGHLPFSHSFERLLPPVDSLNLPTHWFAQPPTDRPAHHEDVSVAAVWQLAQNSPDLLDPEQARDVCALIHDGVLPSPRLRSGSTVAATDPYPLLKHIISGEIDADRMDYLPRDAQFSGVTYGYFDLERLIHGLSCAETEQGLTLALAQDAVLTYENFLMARFHMAMQVYFHKTLLPFAHYLEQAVRTGEVALPFTGSIESLMDSREDSLLATLHAARDRPWSARLVHRQPAARLYRFDGEDSEPDRVQIRSALQDAGIKTIYIREKRRLSSLEATREAGLPPILVQETVLGQARRKSLEKASQLVQHYNRTFIIERLYCDREDYPRARGLLHQLIG